jgi:Caspase domain
VSSRRPQSGSSGKRITSAGTATPRAQPTSNTTPQTFALIIGIDDYLDPRQLPLSGAVNDALQFYRLLKLVFNFPESNISLLCDEEATREVILREMRSLVTNPNIQPGDAVVVYFAGIVGWASAPMSWGCSTVETICPVDEGIEAGDSYSLGIPDRTITALLHDLLEARDVNIVRHSAPLISTFNQQFW